MVEKLLIAINKKMTTCRKLNCTQSYLRIWGSYDPIDSDPSEPK